MWELTPQDRWRRNDLGVVDADEAGERDLVCSGIPPLECFTDTAISWDEWQDRRSRRMVGMPGFEAF